MAQLKISQDVFNLLHPVGSVYISMTSTSPKTLFANYGVTSEWTQVSGRFLYCTTTSKTTGGSAVHSHSYRVGWYGYYGSITNGDTHLIGIYDYVNSKWVYGSGDSGMDGSTYKNSGLVSSTTSLGSINSYSAKASTTESSNMPPYFTVYCWYRTA